jgi:hypothetical protein
MIAQITEMAYQLLQAGVRKLYKLGLIRFALTELQLFNWLTNLTK